MTDIIDPFDSPTSSGIVDPFDAPAPAEANPKPKAPPSSLIRRTLGDTAVDVGRGVIGLGESVVGVADLATGGHAGRALEGVGYRPEETKEIIGDFYSPERKQANAAVEQAEGFTGTVGAMLENPSTIAGAVAESVPQMLGGGAVARGLGAVPKLGAVARAAIGEGAVGAGAAAEGLRQQSDDGLLSERQSIAALGTGVGTGLLGAAGGSVARRLGIGDVDTSLAGDAAAAVDRPGLVRRTLGGAVAEGVLEEAPQSAQEQVWQNFANERSLGEGVGEATAAGLLTGAAIGGPFGAISRPPNAPEADAAADNSIDVERANELLALPSPGPVTVGPDGTAVTPEQAYSQQRADAEFAQGRAARGLTPDVNRARAAHPGAAPQSLPDGSPLPNPANGPLSRGVNIGVQSGAVQQAAADQAAMQAAEAAEQQAKQAKPIEGTAERVDPLPEPLPPKNMDPATGELIPYSEAEIASYINGVLDRGGQTKTKPMAAGFGINPKAMQQIIVRVRDARKKAALAKPNEAANAATERPGAGRIDPARDAVGAGRLSGQDDAGDGGAAAGAGPASAQAAAATDGAPAEKLTAKRLPAELAKARPRYSYGEKKFELEFADDGDRAAYIAAQAKPSKRDADYLRFAQDATGLDEAGVRARGAEIRASIKAMAKDAAPGRLALPAFDAGRADPRSPNTAGSSDLPLSGAPASQPGSVPALDSDSSPQDAPAAPPAQAIGVEEVSDEDMAAHRERNITTEVEGGAWDTAKMLREKPVGDITTIEGEPTAESDGATRWTKLADDQWSDGTSTLSTADLARKFDRAGDVLEGQATRVRPTPLLPAAAAEAATSPTNDRPEPTEAQKEAGNYKKGHARVAGLDVSIENPAGSRRRPEWPPLENHYGYFKGSVGADKDHVDVFLTDRAEDESLPVFVVDQNHRDGKFDEHKVIMGTANEAEARAAYLSNYEKGWTGLGAITQMDQDEFKAWVRDPAKTKRPAARKVQQAAPDALVKVRDIYGASYLTKQSDLDGPRTMLPTYNKDGERRETAKGPINVHRENLATDEQIAEHNKDTKLVSRRGARNEREEGFSKPEVVTREIKRLGLNPDDFEIQRHHGGYVGVRKAAATERAVVDASQARDAAIEYLRGRGWTKASDVQPGMADGNTFQTYVNGHSGPKKKGDIQVSGRFDFSLRDLLAAASTQSVASDPATAPEHSSGPNDDLIGLSPDEMRAMVKEFEAAAASSNDGDNGVHHVFDPPAKSEIFRTADKAKVYHKDHGWMTPAEARAKIDEWKAHAAAQYDDRSSANQNGQRVVLSLFDLSGEWSKPWEEAGYQVYRFDIQDDATYEDSEGNTKNAGDINNLDYEFFVDMFGHFEGADVYAILAACPCTDFAVSGARHFAAKDADGRTVKSVRLVHQTMNLIEHFKPPVWALENPVGRIERLTGIPPWRLSFDPNHFGEDYTKKTLIWGRFNGDLPVAPTEPTAGSKMHTQYGGKSMATKNARSVTPEGFAYSFFMANNAIDHPVMALANQYDRLDRALIAEAVAAGLTPEQINDAVEDAYYSDLDDEKAERELRETIAEHRAETTTSMSTAGNEGPTAPVQAETAEVAIAGWLRKVADEIERQGTNEGRRKLDERWSEGAIKRRVAADGIMAGKRTGAVATAKIAISKAKTPGDLRAAADKLAPRPASEPAGAPVVTANTIFTVEAAEAARAVLRAKLGQLNTGIDPEIMQAGITLAGYHIENGARSFAAYSKAMLADLGEAIRPYLKSWYMGVKFDPRAAAFDGMDTAAAVEAAEIESQSDQRPAPPAEVAQNPAQETTNVRRQDNRPSDRAGSVRSDQREQPAQDRNDDPAANLDPEQRGEAARTRPGRRPAESAETPAPGGARGSVRAADQQSAPDADRVPAERGAPADAVIPKSDLTITGELDFSGIGAVGKFKQNLAAITLLKELEAQGRRATPAEQSTLARYVGWGGLPQAFRHPTTGKVNKGWEARVDELEAALTAEEHAAAGRSTQDAHYTAANVVSAMWDAVQRMGFERGRVLEPSMGTGNFFGLMPTEARAASNLTGVELDPITGRIAQQLYQTANVQVRGFNDIRIAPGSFDLAIGNPPFGSQSIHDPQYPELAGSSIHNFFFAKSIASLRPGGVLAMVVSSSFMDANTSSTRKWISERASLLGAIRLPQTAFQANAGTAVTTDIVFLQRLPEGAKSNPEAWVRVGSASDKGNHFPLNKYFVDHPDMMLGNMVWSSHTTIGRAGAVLEASPDTDLTAALSEAVAKLPQDVYQAPGKTFKQATAKVEEVDTSRTVPVGARVYGFFAHTDGTLRQRQPDYNGEMQSTAVDLPETATARVIGMAHIRDLARDLLAAEHRESATDAQIEAKRAALNTAYDAFVKAYGRLSRDVNKRLYRDDSDIALLLSLERDYDKGVSPTVAKKMGVPSRKESASKADLFKKRLNFPIKPITSVSDAKSAMLASLNERGRLDPEYMTGIYPGKTIEDIEDELGDQVFRTPSGELVPADLYLSGNVKAKLAATKTAAKTDTRLERNVAALEAVQPADVDATDIFVQVGTPWIPASDYADFARETFEGKLTGSYVTALGGWLVNIEATNKLLNNERWGHERLGAAGILELLMANKPVAIYDKGADDKRILNKDDTAAAKGKAEELQQHFLDWIWKDATRRERLARHYNDTYNTDVRWKPSGEHMTFPGKTDAITLRPHQSAFVYRVVQQGVALADHVVGAGKTFANIAAVMEMRRLGLWRKPMIVVPNHLVDQWAKDFALLYPGANVLAATRKDFAKPNRKRLFARIATGDWDAVIVAHSSFGFIPLPPETEKAILGSEIDEIALALDAMRQNNGKKDLSFKQLQKREESLKAKIDALASRPRDDLMDFAEMGVDALSVDEAHEFKNLYFVTTQRGVAGLGSPEGSKKAFDLFVKTRYLADLNGGKNRVFLTGTPVSNSLAEVFHMQRYLQLEELKDRGVAMFDTWASTFGQIVSDWEMDAAGRFKEKSRFRKFANLPELVTLWRGVADTVTLADLKRDAEAQGKRFPVPKIRGGKRNNVTVPRSPLQAAFIGEPEPVMNADGTPMIDKETGIPVEQYPAGSIIHRMDNMPKDPSEDNHLKATGDARKASLDYRLVDPDAPDFPGSKINRAVADIAEIWEANTYRRGTQLIFADLSVPASARGKATESAQARVPTWFIARGEDLEHVAGVKLALSAMPGRGFFSYKTKRDGYAIYEAGSGLYVTSGKTKQEAVDNANAELANKPKAWLANFEAAPIPAEAIDAYVQRWEDEKARKEEEATDTDTDEKAPEQETISMDDLLADQSKHSVYDDVKAKLIAKGIPANEIAFIHDYNTDAQKADLFAKVNRGDIRVLMGSTAKMGAGMNVQKKLVALHHLDAPWRPSDMTQREGRAIRQGNEFYEADPDGFEMILNAYGTQETYDSRQYEIIETKAQGIETFQAGDGAVREIDDIASESANSADMKAAASGNPLILESIKLRKEVRDLEAQEKSHKRAVHTMESLVRSVDNKTAYAYKRLADTSARAKRLGDQAFKLKIGGKTITDPKELKAEPIMVAFKEAIGQREAINAGEFRGMDLVIEARPTALRVALYDGNESIGVTEIGKEDKVNPAGFVTRLENIFKRIEAAVPDAQAYVAKIEREAVQAREEMKRGFPKADELTRKRERQQAVVAALRSGKREVEGDPVPQFSRPNRPAGAGMTAEQVTRAIGATTAAFGRNAPTVRVLATAEELPASAKRDPGYRTAEGYYENGTVYLVAANLRSPTRAVQTLAHEVEGHFGIEAITGPELWGDLGRTIDTMRRSGKHDALFAEIDRRYPGASRGALMGETIAVMTEKGVRNSVVDRVIAAMRRFLRKLGFTLEFTEAELRQHIIRAARFVRGNTTPPTGGRKPLSEFLRGAPVATSEGTRFTMQQDDLRKRVVDYYKQAHNGRAFNLQVGEVLLTQVGVKASIGHGMGEAKTAAFELVPNVIRDGRLISEDVHFRGTRADRLTLAAPVSIAGKDYLMAVVLRRDSNGSRFYFHDVEMTPKKEPPQAVQNGAAIAGGGTVGHAGVIPTLLRDAYEGKLDGKFSQVEDSRQAAHGSEAWLDLMDEALQDSGEQVDSDIDAAKRWNAGERLFALHENAEQPHEVRTLEELTAYTPDQLMALPRSVAAQFGLAEYGADARFARADPIESGAFKAWFRKSKVATAGVPKVVYHGTAEGFWTFDKGRLAGSTGHMSAPLGFFFAEDRGKAERYAAKAADGVPADERVIDVYLSVQNPKLMTTDDLLAIESQDEARALRARLERQGYDGIRLTDIGQWVAFEPSQAKSASENRGGFDPGNDDMRFSKPDPAASIDAVDAAMAGPSESVVDRLKDTFRGLKPENLRENTRPAWLGALTLRHLAELGTDIKLRHVANYSDRVQRMTTDRNVMQEEASEVADAWEKFQRKDRVGADATANLMHDTTIAGVDPSVDYTPMFTGNTKRGPAEAVTAESIARRKALVEADMKKAGGAEARQRLAEESKALDDLLAQERARQAAYPGFVSRYQALPEAGRKLYTEARDAYTKQSDRMEAALVARIQALEVDGRQKAAMIGQIRQQFESARLNGPYFPLQRFGEFWISAENASGEPAFLMYEKVESWREAQRDLKARGFTIKNAGRKLDEARSLAGASGGFIADLQALLETAGIDGDTRDEVYQLYLRTLPELSMRKHQIHRKATRGYSNDALRAFSSNLFHGSFQIARLRHAHELEADLLTMKKAVGDMTGSDPERAAKAGALYSEVNKRHEWVMNPKDSSVASGLTSLGFAWYLGTTPAAALVNLTQTAIVTFPVLASRFGAAKAFNALSDGMGRAMRNADGNLTRGLNDEERAAFKVWYESGAIDRSQAHNLAGLSETDTRAFNPVVRRGMQVVSFLFHKAEVVNREASALAAFRLARAAGQSFNEATQYAGEVVTETHFDYSNANRARFMQSNAAKVLLLFRQYSLNMTWFLWRNAYQSIKAESPEVRVEARKKLAGVLGMTGIFAGALGMPLTSVMFGVANAAAAAFGGDDDEPWDAEVEFRNFLADLLGPDVARIIARGPVDYITGANISGRVSLNDLWFREPNRELEGKAMANYLLEQAAGPLFGGMLVNTLRGLSMVNEGHTWRGVETMMPKAVKDGMKAVRYSTEGVNTMRGDPIIEDLNVGQALLQLAGFSPASLNDRYDAINASKGYEDHIMRRRSSLLNAYAMAWRAGDGETLRDVMQKIRSFNEAQPRVPITVSTIRTSLAARMRYSSRAESGVVLNPKLADRAREQGRFAE